MGRPKRHRREEEAATEAAKVLQCRWKHRTRKHARTHANTHTRALSTRLSLWHARALSHVYECEPPSICHEQRAMKKGKTSRTHCLASSYNPARGHPARACVCVRVSACV